jgi:hypothetical protein
MEYGELGSFEEHQNKWKGMTWKTQIIRNVPELQEANWSEVVVGEVGTAAHKILVAALFAIHVVMQWISFESIAKSSILNEINQLTWSIACCWVKAWESSTHPAALVQRLTVSAICPATSDSPWAFWSRDVLLSGEARSYSLSSVTTEQPSELSPPGSQLFHWTWHTCNMCYIRSKTLQRQIIRMEPSARCPWLFPALLAYKVLGSTFAFLQSTCFPWCLTISWAYWFCQKYQKLRLEREQ